MCLLRKEERNGFNRLMLSLLASVFAFVKLVPQIHLIIKIKSIGVLQTITVSFFCVYMQFIGTYIFKV